MAIKKRNVACVHRRNISQYDSGERCGPWASCFILHVLLIVDKTECLNKLIVAILDAKCKKQIEKRSVRVVPSETDKDLMTKKSKKILDDTYMVLIFISSQDL
jgi:hypothetical protein